jgi:RNA polymerase primary sigma factor
MSPEGAFEGSLAELDRLLRELEREHPELSDARVDREVSDLLGRNVPGSQRPTSPAGALTRARQKRRRSVFKWYARLVADWPVLSQRETVAAARSVEVGLLAAERLDRLLHGAVADRAQVMDLRELIARGQRAFDLLVASNLRLVFHWSKGVATTVDDDWAQDAFQAGCIGLMRGIQGWDHAKGFALSTFVSWHIRQSIQRWRANEILLIRIPVHVWEALESKDPQLAPALRAAANRSLGLRSLDAMDTNGPEFVSDARLEESLEAEEKRDAIERLLATLSEREASVIRDRYGVGGDPKTLEEIGLTWDVTRERIRQIEYKAMEKLRHPSRSHSLRAFLG